MRRKLIGLVISLIIILSLIAGCIDDSGDGDDKKTNKPPIADAGTDIEVLSMIEVQFNSTNSSDPDGSINSYSWTFGDKMNPGQDFSTEANPKYLYNSPGVYTVTLTIMDNEDANDTDSLTVTVKNRKPEAEIGDDISTEIFKIVEFNISATDADGYIRSFEWDFDGDNAFDWYSNALVTAKHFYENPGTYEAALRVTDNYEGITIVKRKITVTQPQNSAPVADAGLNQSVHSGEVLFKGTAFDIDGTISKYEWDFDGDDTFDWSGEDGGIVNHIYPNEGEYEAKLQVTDNLGLTATDSVHIIINESLDPKNTSAMILLSWLTGLEYSIVLNNTINQSLLKVVITDITLGIMEDFSGLEITKINELHFGVSSLILPMPKHTLDVQVFLNGALIGARVLEMINENHETIGPGFDYKAVYSWDHLMEEKNRGGIDSVSLKSIGSTEVTHKGSLYYYTVSGTGEYYFKQESEGYSSEATIECTSLFVNLTISETTIISKSISLVGHGPMSMTLGGVINVNLNMKNIRIDIENNQKLKSYMVGTGTFAGATVNPNDGSIIPIGGNASFTSELLGYNNQKNRDGKEFACNVEHTNLTLIGMTAIPNSTSNFPILMTLLNTTWQADSQKYSNNVIYYEFTTINVFGDVEIRQSGSVLPKDSPKDKVAEIHISDALSLNLPRPRIYMPGDLMAYMSDTGVILQLIVEPGEGTKIKGEDYTTAVLNGTLSGSAEGFFAITVVNTGKFAGLAIHTIEDYKWNNERLVAEISLKTINN
jgi:PKD repeat protein